MKDKSVVKTNWLEAREAAAYMKKDYRRTIDCFNEGKIRFVKDGRKYLTRTDWVDEYLFSLENTGILCRR